MPRAIEFVEAHDKDLWYRLIEHSLKNEAFLSGLLDHAGVYDVDLARLIAEIPKGMHIPGLRDKVVKIISDYHFQVQVQRELLVELTVCDESECHDCVGVIFFIRDITPLSAR